MSSVKSVASSFLTRGTYITNRLNSFMERSGYDIYKNQFYRLVVPKLVSNVEPEEQTEVFLSSLPTDMLEDEIFSMFSSVGEIYEIRLMVTASGILNRSFAYVRYYRQEEADEAVKKLHRSKAGNGKQIRVVKSQDNKKLFIKGINKKMNAQEIFMELRSKGVQGVKSVLLVAACKLHDVHRGFAFVEFVNHAAAASAKWIFKDRPMVLFERRILIQWAVEKQTFESRGLHGVEVMFANPSEVENTYGADFPST